MGIVDDQIVATVMAGYDGHRGWLNYLAVAPENRRTGLARQMMTEVEHRLFASGCPKINLQVRNDNAESIGFYRAIGYTQDAVISMGKRLEAGVRPDDEISLTYVPPTDKQTSDAEIAACTVGELKAHDAPIHLADYDTAWPTFFQREAQRIREALGDRVVQLEHVGSTSVPGLAAKPLIDILLVVPDSSDEPMYLPALERRGYGLQIREPDWYQHRLLKGPDTNINLHVLSTGCVEIHRMLLFRDWLRTHLDDRLLYEQTKRELASSTWKHVQNYADAKTKVVQEILGRALRP